LLYCKQRREHSTRKVHVRTLGGVVNETVAEESDLIDLICVFPPAPHVNNVDESASSYLADRNWTLSTNGVPKQAAPSRHTAMKVAMLLKCHTILTK
jgi:hypothetical protein